MGKHKQQQDESDCSQQSNEQQKAPIRKPKIDRIDKFKSLKKVVINVSMTQYPVVTQVAENLDWKIQYSNDAGDWDVYWTDFAIDPDILIKMHLFQKINHYPGIHVIARKNLLGLNLMSLRNKFADQYNFFPLTWMLPLQYAEFRAYYETKPKGKARTYIAKPQAECQGRGIFLTRKIQDLQNGKHYVVQRYLARPYLIEGLKFDLRIYVLLCGTNPLRLYMYKQGLARLATQPYVQPTTSNLEKQYIHLTNYAINKNNPKFIFNNNSNNMGVGHKRSITSVFKQLEQAGVNITVLKQKINDVAIKTVVCGLPLMSHQYKCSQPEDYSGNMCFHLLGLDIMLNSLAEPVLLEVNHTPSFTTDTPLDHKIKFNLIKDTLKLMNINVQTKNQLFNKTKELNMDRLVTGKRQIYQGKQREEAIKNAQALRDQYEDKNLGGFSRIFPINDEQKMKKYNNIIEVATKTYYEQNSSVRMKMMDKQAKKLIKSDIKQVSKGKTCSVQANKSNPSDDLRSQISHLRQNSINKVINSQMNECKSVIIGQQSGSPLFQRDNQLTKSQYKPNKQVDLENKSQIFIPDAKRQNIQKVEMAAHPNSIIKIKKYQIQKERQVTKETRLNRQIKSTTMPKQNQKQRIFDAPNNQSIFQKKQPISQCRFKNLSRKQKTGHNNNDVFPSIVDSYMINSEVHSLKNEEKLQTMNRGQNIMKASSRSGKIYELIAKDMRQLVDRKTRVQGDFVMPKLVSLNYDNERKSTEDPSSGAFPQRKGNIFQNNNQ